MEQKGRENYGSQNVDMGYEIVNSKTKETIFDEIKTGLRNNSVGYSPAVNSLRIALETIEEEEQLRF